MMRDVTLSSAHALHIVAALAGTHDVEGCRTCRNAKAIVADVFGAKEGE